MTTIFNTYDYFYSQIDHEKGIGEKKVALMALSAGMPAWGDPRFTNAINWILNRMFLRSSKWLKGQYLAKRVVDNADHCIDPDLVEIAKSLLKGEVPENPAWNDGMKYYACRWPAPLTRYANPWNGTMFTWAIAIDADRIFTSRMHLRLNRKKAPRRLEDF